MKLFVMYLYNDLLLLYFLSNIQPNFSCYPTIFERSIYNTLLWAILAQMVPTFRLILIFHCLFKKPLDQNAGTVIKLSIFRQNIINVCELLFNSYTSTLSLAITLLLCHLSGIWIYWVIREQRYKKSRRSMTTCTCMCRQLLGPGQMRLFLFLNVKNFGCPSFLSFNRVFSFKIQPFIYFFST